MGVYALMSGSFLDKKIATQSPCIKKINKIILMETH
jgi:hypothetical protein